MKTMMAVLLGFISINLFAQGSNNLENNPDVLFLEEITIPVSPDIDYDSIPYTSKKTSSALLKFQRVAEKNSEIYSYSSSDKDLIFFIANARPKNLYKDKSLKEMYSEKESRCKFSCVDTVGKDVVVHQLKFINLRYNGRYHLHGKLYYHKKDKMIRLEPISIAPVMKKNKSTLENPEFEELFWIPVASTDQLNLNNDDISWVKRVGYQLASDKAPQEMYAYALKDILDNSDKTPVYQIFGQFLEHPKAIKAKQLATLFEERADTVISFDPASFEERVDIVRYTVTKEVVDLLFTQDWAWNHREKKLYIRPLAFKFYNKVQLPPNSKDAFNMNYRMLFSRIEKGVKLPKE